ncbi:uncharacterized protein F54H12.2-like [Colossoma macropomum]|uniref:uncharacterized protein F54H12.2-like n=1 Tax=Colossoma macropomum TaxID=42526 RepID=UPI001864AD73|nr:uncharacterized protein F54H12.2-like [Colossoma macropomum]
MSLIHSASAECMKSELDLFTIPMTQHSIESYKYVETPPITAITKNGPLEFFIAGSGDTYVDLNRSLLYLTCKVTNTDGTDLAAGAAVGLINYPAATLFSQVDLSLGDKLISQSGSTYAYRAVLECLLNYSEPTLNSQFAAGLFRKDAAGRMDEADPNRDNEGLTWRSAYCERSRTFELMGHLHNDFAFQEKLLLNSVDMRIKLVRNKNEFVLMSSDPNPGYKLHILTALLYVKRRHVSPSVKLGHASALLQSNARYPLERVNVKVLSVPAGGRVSNQDNLFLGQVPKFIAIGFVHNEAFSGSYARNPFNFHHYDVESLNLSVDGVSYPSTPFRPLFPRQRCLREYFSLVEATDRGLRDQPLAISREDFSQGYCLFAFNLTPDESSGEYVSLIQSGHVRLDLRFRAPLPNTINIIVFAVFDNVLEINHKREVLMDYF